MKIDDRYERLENYDLYDELPLPIKVKDNTEYRTPEYEEFEI